MSASVSILGNLGRTPETRVTPEGTFIANFSIASNSVHQTPQGSQTKTNWYRVTALGNQGKTLAQYAKKGNRLLVQGKLTFKAWVDREGAPQVSADLLLQDFEFVDNAEQREDENGGADGKKAEYAIETEIPADEVQEIANQTHCY